MIKKHFIALAEAARGPTLAIKTIKPAWSKVPLILRAVGGLEYLKGNHAPYFTLTKEEHRRGFPNQCQSCGCDHETLLMHWPQFADLAALHLSDIDGVPIYAETNGWYMLAGALPRNAGEKYHAGNSRQNFPKPKGAPRKHEWDTTDYRNPTPDECLQMFANHARIDIESAQEVRQLIVDAFRANGDWDHARVVFARWIEGQKPRWKSEAEACIRKHRLRVFGDEWKEREKGV